jgi:hypothetical protein
MRYFFDLRKGDEVAIDEEGVELPTIEAVQEEAARSLADVARDAVHNAHKNGAGHQMSIEVRDEQGAVLQAKFTFDLTRLRK